MTGLSSRIAAASSPLASAGPEGMTTTRPGRWQKSASRLCECCAARRTPPPEAPRTTSGMRGVPPIMKRSFAAWFASWSMATVTKSENCSSTTGRIPVSAAPTPAPTKPHSEMGVSRTRSAPKRSCMPSVARKTPPTLPTSSPMTKTVSSASISCQRASRTAWVNVSARSPAGAGTGYSATCEA